MKPMRLILKTAAAVLAVCAALYVVLNFWDEISQFFARLWERITIRCCASGAHEDDFAEVDE
jgi:hypothetical protein